MLKSAIGVAVERSGITVEEISKQTNIQKFYLKKILEEPERSRVATIQRILNVINHGWTHLITPND